MSKDTLIKNNLLLIIDGSNLMHRNYYVNKELKTKNEVYTGAIYGTIKMIKKFIEKYNPKKIIICFDKSKKTFRNEIFPEYKGTRKPNDIELRSQFPFLLDFCKLTNIPFIQYNRYEADDLIGSIAKNATKYGYNPYIISGDKDTFQLIDKNINVLYLSRNGEGTVKYDEDLFFSKFEITVDKFIDYKAIVGDLGDNIKGVSGIGEKTAVKLLNSYNSIEGIYENLDKIKGKMKEHLENNKESAFLSKILATIKCDIDLPYNELFSNIDYDFNNELLKNFLNSLEINIDFKTL